MSLDQMTYVRCIRTTLTLPYILSTAVSRIAWVVVGTRVCVYKSALRRVQKSLGDMTHGSSGKCPALPVTSMPD